MTERWCTATKEHPQTRLSRIEGQVSAIRSALDKVGLGLLDGHTRHCLAGGHGGPTDPDERADEQMQAVGRLLR